MLAVEQEHGYRGVNRGQYTARIHKYQVRSGQVRSECLTCTFRASCCSARLSRALVWPSPFPLSGTGKINKRGVGGGGEGGEGE